MELDREPFLPQKEADGEFFESASTESLAKRSTVRAGLKLQLFVHSGLVFFYTIASFVAIRSFSRPARLPEAAVSNLEFKYTGSVFHRLNNTPFAGPPSPELDAAWQNLLAPMHIRITEEELQQDNQTSVALTEGGGFLGWLGVFHELHCIVRRARLAPS